ncbi:type I-E CRISPR-associated protein Cse2/CasB [Streptomyces sp. NPDC060243]|uniref:type I-E CRISPR-associated protein Cse2/CasB n=1 Tax=Streptomyces sp. NPDC060243 TaxID=3347081 RepID=UPI0036556376
MAERTEAVGEQVAAGFGSAEIPHDSSALLVWLTQLVRTHENGTLAELRRAGEPTNAHIRAGWFGGDEHRELFERVAFLFAVYHQGRSVPSYGLDSLGGAVRRIGSGKEWGPTNPGAVRLVARVVASRRVPWRHLQHVVTRLRSLDKAPPRWDKLIEDLLRWEDRSARVAYNWSVDFYAPDHRRGK